MKPHNHTEKTSGETMPAELVLDAKATLGEGAIWDAEREQLLWVDIEGRKFFCFDPSTGDIRSFATGSRVGTVVPVSGGGVLLALQNGIHEMDLDTGALTYLGNPLPGNNLRFNDGKCDPSGRFWVGSMDLYLKEGAATLYRMEGDLRIHDVLHGVTISNGIVWTADKKTMYYIDTPTLTVQAFDYDDKTGALANRRVVVNIPADAGSPDGMTIDAEDKVWVALWGGYAVGHFDPQTGELLQKICLPAPNVSSCAFGGAGLETLYITTARSGLSADLLAAFPLSGGVFAVKPGVRGVSATAFSKKG